MPPVSLAYVPSHCESGTPGRGDDELLHAAAGVRLLCDHDAAGKEEAIERHGLGAVRLRDRPVASEIRQDVLGAAEAGATDKNDVGVLADGRVRREDRLVEVLARVMAARAAARPLHDDGEVGVGGRDVDDLADAVDAAGLERDVADADAAEAVDDLGRLVDARDARGDAEALDRDALALHLHPQRELERELARVDVQRVERQTDAGGDLGLDLGDLGAESRRVVMAATCELDVVAGAEDGADETALHSRRRHASDHKRRLAQETREWRVQLKLAISAGV